MPTVNKSAPTWNDPIKPRWAALQTHIGYELEGRGDESPCPVHVDQGGTRSGKTYGILQLLTLLIIRSLYKPGAPTKLRRYMRRKIEQGRGNTLTIEIVRLNGTWLADAIDDFRQILTDSGLWFPDIKIDGDKAWNNILKIYRFSSVVDGEEYNIKWQFQGYKDAQKARGPKRDILFINECNELYEEIYTQLKMRTMLFMFLDYNPSHKFWLHNLILDKTQEEAPRAFQITTYKDNKSLTKSEIANIEAKSFDPFYAAVYLRGELGVWEGKIYKHWRKNTYAEFESIRCNHRDEEFWGGDFGSDAPSTRVHVKYFEGVYYAHLTCYRTGMSHDDHLEGWEESRGHYAYVDWDYQVIDGCKKRGLLLNKATKNGNGANMDFQIQFIQRLADRVVITAESKELWEEADAFEFAKDRNGKAIYGKPDDRCSDHALDALRYAIFSWNWHLGRGR